MEKPAIEGGKPVRTSFLPFGQPWIDNEEVQEVAKVIKSGWLTSGPKTFEFEEKFREFVGSKEAIAINSCTGGLHLSLVALDIGSGDEVITSPFTFAATGNVIIHSGAKPVFVDIDPETYNIDPENINAAITNKTKAIIPVHYGGHPCDMKEIIEIAEDHNLYVIEDAAHAVGAKFEDRNIGTISNATAFSFYAIKNMTTGEGGMVTTDDRILAEKIRKLRLHGISQDAWKRYDKIGSWYYEIEFAGFKYNMTDIQAAMGLVQLKKLQKFLSIRERHAEYLTEKLKKFKELKLPSKKENVKHAWHLYPILINSDSAGLSRDKFIDALRAENIGTSVHFIPLHLHPFYKRNFGYKSDDYPNSKNVYERILSLPLYPKMDQQDLKDVIKAVTKIIEYY